MAEENPTNSLIEENRLRERSTRFTDATEANLNSDVEQQRVVLERATGTSTKGPVFSTQSKEIEFIKNAQQNSNQSPITNSNTKNSPNSPAAEVKNANERAGDGVTLPSLVTSQELKNLGVQESGIGMFFTEIEDEVQEHFIKKYFSARARKATCCVIMVIVVISIFTIFTTHHHLKKQQKKHLEQQAARANSAETGGSPNNPWDPNTLPPENTTTDSNGNLINNHIDANNLNELSQNPQHVGQKSEEAKRKHKCCVITAVSITAGVLAVVGVIVALVACHHGGGGPKGGH